MTDSSYKRNIKRCIQILAEDLFLSDEDLESAFKVVYKVDFVGRPSVIAVSIIYQLRPERYDLIMFTSNITRESLQSTTEKLRKIKV